MRELLITLWLFGGFVTIGYVNNVTPITKTTKAISVVAFWPVYIGAMLPTKESKGA